MNQTLILSIFAIYTLLIFFITWLTSRKANDSAFYQGNRRSPWYVVAYGMIGASLSGVTFMSVPGWVKDTQFSYMLVVLGYMVGYAVVATILLPLYYRLNLTSIYTYLQQRFGNGTYKTGASFFLLSRTIGASLRMFLVVYVLHLFVFQGWGIPFWAVGFIFVLLVLAYTFKGGIKTIVWTDTLQTTFMLLAVVISVVLIGKEMGWSLKEIFSRVKESEYSTMIVTDWTDKRFFLKQFLSGIFITIAMTGLDQEMMQKNLSCRNLKEAQKNMFTFSGTLLVINFLFLILGAVLIMYAQSNNISIAETDRLFPDIAINHLGTLAGVIFLIGLISAAYPSADGALTSLTTSFCIDILELDKRDITDQEKKRIRYTTHGLLALLFLLLIIFFRYINDSAVIDKLFTIAGYTYGPLLGFFSFGLFTRIKVYDKAIPFVGIVSPLITYILDQNSVSWFGGYKFGFELLIVNGLITFFGLWLCRIRQK